MSGVDINDVYVPRHLARRPRRVFPAIRLARVTRRVNTSGRSQSEELPGWLNGGGGSHGDAAPAAHTTSPTK